jgi:predicted nucleic acid-binding protein
VRFVDSSYWVALQLARDERHELAVALWRDRGSARLLTTNHVVGETWTYLRRRAGHAAARRFVEHAQRSPSLVIHWVERSVEEDAWRWLRRHDEREYSFVDATSFAVMRRLRLTGALAFDGDFAAARFVELRPGEPG